MIRKGEKLSKNQLIGYGLRSDNHNWILFEKQQREDDTIIEKDIGYYSSLRGLLEGGGDRILRVNGIEKLALAFDQFEELITATVELLENL